MCNFFCTGGRRIQVTVMGIFLFSFYFSAAVAQNKQYGIADHVPSSSVTYVKSSEATAQTKTRVELALLDGTIEVWNGAFATTGDPQINGLHQDPSGMVIVEGQRMQGRSPLSILQPRHFVLVFNQDGTILWSHENRPGRHELKVIRDSDGRTGLAGFDTVGEPFAVLISQNHWTDLLPVNPNQAAKGKGTDPDPFEEEPEDTDPPQPQDPYP